MGRHSKPDVFVKYVNALHTACTEVTISGRFPLTLTFVKGVVLLMLYD